MQYDRELTNYSDLHQWSLEYPEDFWRSVWAFTAIIGECGDIIKTETEHFESCQWFPKGELNFAENLLKRRDDTPAIIAINELHQEKTITWNQLYRQVAQVAHQLQKWGFVSGDVAAGYLPNGPEAVIAMLAVTALGGTWSSTSPDFGFDSVLERFGQIQPKVFFCCTQTTYAGQQYDRRDLVTSIAQKITSIEQVVVLEDHPFPRTNTVSWRLFLKSPVTEIDFQRFPAEQPLYILYSSGTTGKPKCIVHRCGGVLVQHKKEHMLHCDIKPGDRVFYYTTCGWMMWNWLVSTLACEATIILYDGSPTHPSPLCLWEYAQKQAWTLFGTSARYLDTLNKNQHWPQTLGDFPTLKTICSTGSVLSPEAFQFVYDHIKADVHLASISGGTDLCGCFALGNPISPVYAGQLQCPGLGMHVDVFDSQGQSCACLQPGELVCKQPFPSQPLCFLSDLSNNKYRAAYFEKYNNIWCHGDWVMRTEEDGFIFLGRSDATLNPGGVRIGTAEIYRQVEQLDEIQESLVIGQDWQGDQRIILFVTLTKSATLDTCLKQKICNCLRQKCSPRHVPDKIFQVSDMPRTKSGKLVEIAVRQLVNGGVITNQNALVNPQVLDEFIQQDDEPPQN